MDIQLRPIAPDEFEAFARADSAAFGHHVTAEELERYRRTFEFDRSIAAFDGAELVGATGALTMQLSTPGGDLPTAGVTAVGVMPTHRRRGILTTMMRQQLHDVRDHGEPLAALWASEGSIYGRFGYGLSTLHGRVDADRDRAVFVNQDDDHGRVRLAEKDELLRVAPEIYERQRSVRAGMPAWSQGLWENEFADPESERGGASALFFVIHETAGSPDGYATYRTRSDWSEGIASGTVNVGALMAENADAYRALWRFVFGIDLIKRVESWGRPADEPLLHMVTEPRRLRFRLSDALYVRILDVPAALEGRRYRSAGSVVLDVRDPFLAWAEGRFRLEGGPDGATCRPTTEEPDLRLSINDLAVAYLGQTGFAALAAAGRVIEDTPNALEVAGRMFATKQAPWCPMLF
jgi:predicted acetyltransferase